MSFMKSGRQEMATVVNELKRLTVDSGADPLARARPEICHTRLSEHPEQPQLGVVCALGAFVWWGCAVFYFKAIEHVPVMEILAHRILWSAALLVGHLAATRRLRATALAVWNYRTAGTLAITSVLIASSWFIMVWAVTHDRVLETSMGYFLCPLVSMGLGFLFLRERFRSLQLVGVVLACLAVAILGIHTGKIPAVSLALAFTFGFYGLLRKGATVDGIAGLAAESLMLSPLALSYLIYLDSTDALVFGHADRVTDLLLMAAGVVTSVPLVLFVAGAKRLRYATIGILQYLMPTMTFLIAIFVFHEPLDVVQLFIFATIWAAVVLYSVDTMKPSSNRWR
jgi:chloramphenicol-sensitive protein RarD